MSEYKKALAERYWIYQQDCFPNAEKYFEKPFAPGVRPPVFWVNQAHHNVITNPGATQAEIDRVLVLLPAGERHKWFRSMNSSQALAQSVFGNLAIYNHLDSLAELRDDEGLPTFGPALLSKKTYSMERKVHHLGEPTSTSLDAYIDGPYRVAIECKFTEAEVGSCSRPRLKPSASNYSTDHCNGSYTRQLGWITRCSLSESGVLYWRYVPKLFNWSNDQDISPCPLYRNYQLVRNILAIGVRPDGQCSHGRGHVVLIYDERNPAFREGGAGLAAFTCTRSALKEPAMLRKCSWQRIIERIRRRGILSWLTEELERKYGF